MSPKHGFSLYLLKFVWLGLLYSQAMKIISNITTYFSHSNQATHLRWKWSEINVGLKWLVLPVFRFSQLMPPVCPAVFQESKDVWLQGQSNLTQQRWVTHWCEVSSISQCSRQNFFASTSKFENSPNSYQFLSKLLKPQCAKKGWISGVYELIERIQARHVGRQHRNLVGTTSRPTKFQCQMMFSLMVTPPLKLNQLSTVPAGSPLSTKPLCILLV